MAVSSTKENYKQKLLHAKSLKDRGRESLHELIVTLVAVFNDSDFRADTGGDDFKWAEFLDGYLEHTALSFLEARMVLEYFPNFESWGRTPIRQLYQQAQDKSIQAQESEIPRRNSTTRVTKAEYARVESRAKTAEAEVKHLREVISDVENAGKIGIIEKLQREIERLKQKNGQLIAEIERLKEELRRAKLKGGLDK